MPAVWAFHKQKWPASFLSITDKLSLGIYILGSLVQQSDVWLDLILTQDHTCSFQVFVDCGGKRYGKTH